MSTPWLTLTPKQAVGLSLKFVLIQLGFIVLVAIGTAIAAGIRGQHATGINEVNPVALIFVNTFAAFFVVRGQLRKSRLRWGIFFRTSTRWVTLLPVFLLILIGEAIVVSETGNVLTAALPPPPWLRRTVSSISDLVGHPLSGPLQMIVVAAVTEEFLFRGLILRGLLAKNTPGRAIVYSAMLFAAMHMNPWQMQGAFFGGMILGWVYLRTGSLALCIVGHGFHNAICLLANGLPFTVDGFNRAHDPNVVLFQPWWFNLLGVAALALGAYLFNRMAPVLAWIPSVQKIEPPSLPITAVVADGLEGKIE